MGSHPLSIEAFTASITACVFLEFFFILSFFDLSKIYINFFLQNCHPAAGSFGGKEIPPDEPAVWALGHRLTAFRRFNWR